MEVLSVPKRLVALGLMFWMLAASVTAPMAVAAQEEGQLVQAPDGTLYVVEGGQLHAIEPVPLSIPQLLGVPLGEPVRMGVRMIQDAGPLVALPPEPAGAAPPPPPARNTGENAGLRLEVLSVERPFTFSKVPGSGRDWAQIRIRITNIADGSIVTGSWINNMRVQLANGSTVDWGNPTGASRPSDELGGTTLLPGTAIEGNTLWALPVGQRVAKVLWSRGGQIVEAVVD